MSDWIKRFLIAVGVYAGESKRLGAWTSKGGDDERRRRRRKLERQARAAHYRRCRVAS